jgi:hypothetical protein
VPRYSAPSSGGGSVSDATQAAKGVVQLTGDLEGSASAPLVRSILGRPVSRQMSQKYDLTTIVPVKQPTSPLAITTYQGAPNGVVEPSVIHFPEGFGADTNGKAWKYWMTFGAYNQPPAVATITENSCVQVSDDGITWVVPPGGPDPINATPASGNYCDPQLFVGPDGVMYLSWTWQASNVGSQNGVYYRTTTDGINWSAATKILSPADTSNGSLALDLLSVRFQYHNKLWHCWTLDYSTAAPTTGRIRYRNAATLAGLDAAAMTTVTGIAAIGASAGLFEFEVKRVRDEWWLLEVDKNPGNVSLCTSGDGITWTQSPLITKGLGGTGIWNSSMYKSAFVAVEDGNGILLRLWLNGQGNVTGAPQWAVGYAETRNGWQVSKTDTNATVAGQDALLAARSSYGSWTSPARTTAFGYQALKALTSGTNNTAVGDNALAAVTTATDNTAVGNSAMAAATGTQSVGIGTQALNSASGTSNVGVGYSALVANTTGANNTGVGWRALRDNTTGTRNTGLGYQAGYPAVDGSDHTFIGYQAGPTVATTFNNMTCIGSQAKTEGNNAIAIGRSVSATANGAVAIGRDSGNTSATATGQDDFVLGTAGHKVKVPGRLNVAQRTPTASNDSQGTVGDIAADDTYIYVKASTGWKRLSAALVTF